MGFSCFPSTLAFGPTLRSRDATVLEVDPGHIAGGRLPPDPNPSFGYPGTDTCYLIKSPIKSASYLEYTIETIFAYDALLSPRPPEAGSADGGITLAHCISSSCLECATLYSQPTNYCFVI